MMLTMIIQQIVELNAVMYTAQNESEAVCLLGECIFSQQRERERKREILSSASSSSAS